MSTVVQYKAIQIKVHEQNSNGDNLGVQLSHANKIRVRHVDGIVEYNIISRNKIGSHWIFDVNMPWNVTGSDTTNAPVSIEPSLTADFEASDYNVLVNNVQQSRVYGKKQIVDWKLADYLNDLLEAGKQHGSDLL